MRNVGRRGCLSHRREGWSRASRLQSQNWPSLLPQNIYRAAPGSLWERQIFFQGKTMRTVEEWSRQASHHAFLILTHVHGKTRDSLDKSFSLKETVPCILPPLHCKHPAKACSPFLCGHSRLGENGRWPLKVFHHWGEWCSGSEHQPWPKPLYLGSNPTLGIASYDFV